MNANLAKKALEKVLNPHVLVNLVSQRVRQLSNGARPLVIDVGTLGLADIVLREIIEDKIGYDMPEIIQLIRPTGRNRKRPSSWGRTRTASGGEENGAGDLPARKRAAA